MDSTKRLNDDKSGLTVELMALRAAKELREGYYVNLGFGLTAMIPNFVPEGMEVFFHSENGVLGYSTIVEEDMWDADYRSAAGGNPIVLTPGASIFNVVDAFAMMRGGHLDISFLGAFQVSAKGDLANWMLPTRKLGGPGGAMDLVFGAKRVIVIMKHVDPFGKPRIVEECSYPLTGEKCVNTIITDLTVIEVTAQGLLLKEVAPGFTEEEVKAVTEAKLIVADDLKEIEF